MQVERMFDEILQRGPLNGLINNAAENFIARTERLSPRAFDSILNIVLHGTAYCSIAVGRRWIDATLPGTILSIVSSATWQGRPFTVPSSAAKAGVLAMMKSLAVEWGPKVSAPSVLLQVCSPQKVLGIDCTQMNRRPSRRICKCREANGRPRRDREPRLLPDVGLLRLH